MNFTGMLAGGAIIGVLTSCWGHIKAFVWKFIGVFVARVYIHDTSSEYIKNHVVAYMLKHYRHSNTYDRLFNGRNQYVRQTSSYEIIPYEHFGEHPIVFWSKCLPIFYSCGQSKGDNTNKSSDPCMTYIRGTFNIDQVFKNAIDEHNKRVKNVTSLNEKKRERFFIKYCPDGAASASPSEGGMDWYYQPQYKLLSHKPEDLGLKSCSKEKLLERLIFPESIKTCIQEIRIWAENQEWYKQKGIPWKRGWILYGIPGTGKTALTRAFAEDLDLPVYVFNLAEMDNFLMMKSWKDMQRSVPCIALIEDIDNVFHGRTNITANQNMSFTVVQPDNSKKAGSDGDKKEDKRNRHGLLTFDCLLNCIDGIDRNEGVFTIITTNDITKIDPALGQPTQLEGGQVDFVSTRPGRIDKVIQLTYMEPDDKKIMAKRILEEYPTCLEAMVKWIDNNPCHKDTPAQFQDKCAQVALQEFWKKNHPERKPA